MLSENSCIGDTEPAMDGREKAAAAMLSGNTLMPVAWGTAGAIEINK